jgi:hypothetical protein
MKTILKKAVAAFIKFWSLPHFMLVNFLFISIQVYYKVEVNYGYWVCFFLLMIWFVLDDIRTAVKKEKTIYIKNNVNTILKNNTGIDLSIEDSEEDD